MTTPDVAQDERPPVGPWVIGQAGLGAVTVTTAAASVFGLVGLLIAGLLGGLGVAGLVIGRKHQQHRNKQHRNRTASHTGGAGRRSGLFGGRGRGHGTGSGRGGRGRGSGLLPGSRSRKNGKGAESGKGRKGKANGAKSSGLLPRGKGRKAGKDGTSGNGRKRGKGSESGKGLGGKLRNLFGRGKGSQGGSGGGGKSSKRKGGKGSGSTGRGGGLPSWLGGKGKRAKKKQKNGPCGPGTGRGDTKSGTSPDGLNPPPVSTRGGTGAQRPGDQPAKTSGNTGSGNGKKQDDASTGGSSREVRNMGRIKDAADGYAEAVKHQPLENARDMETALQDLADAEEAFATAKSALASRIAEEFPADDAIPEAISEQSRNQRASAAGMAAFKPLFRRRHQNDYERFEQPRTQEQKMDYRAQND